MFQKRAIKGRIAQVDICTDEAGYVLSVGPVSLWLQREEAQDVLNTLKRALALEAQGVELDGELDGALDPAVRPDETELAKGESLAPPRSN